jgi:hypothetical protein
MAKQAKRQLAGSGEALPAGAIGEVKYASFVGNIAADAQYAAYSFIDLTPGVWQLSGNFGGTNLGVALSQYVGYWGIAGSGTELRGGTNEVWSTTSTGSGFFRVLMPTITIRFDGTTITTESGGTIAGNRIYLKLFANYGGAANAGAWYTYMVARRVA